MKMDKEEEGDSIICEKMDLGEPICYTCKHYVEMRVPDQKAEFTPAEGYCMELNEITLDIQGFAWIPGRNFILLENIGFPQFPESHTVFLKNDSFCNRFEHCIASLNGKAVLQHE